VHKPLRIVHCFRSPVGGIFRHVRDLTTAQVRAGHQVGIVCDSTTGGAYEERLFEELAPSLALGCWRTPMQRHIGPGDMVAAMKTFRIIKKLQPDVLHGHGAKGGVYARVFGSLLRVSRSRVARLYSPHGGSLHYDEKSALGRVFFLVEGMMERLSDHLLFVSDYERQTYIRKVGKPRCRSSLVYNGLTTPEFTPVRPHDSAADFLYIGMMRSLKGPDLFLEALAKVELRTDRKVSAVMVGDGDELPDFRALCASLGLADRVTFLPPMPARQAFALGRIIVVPSRAEAMPYIVLEALAAGKPMVASAVGGIPEIFGRDCRAIVPPTASRLADRMAMALTDGAAFASLMPTQDDLRSRFEAGVMAAAIEAAYRQSLSEQEVIRPDDAVAGSKTAER
jgi:glycosyltransferase involved in cell wall biosynthesis